MFARVARLRLALAPRSSRAALGAPAAVLATAMLCACSGTSTGTGVPGGQAGGEENAPSESSGGTTTGGTGEVGGSSGTSGTPSVPAGAKIIFTTATEFTGDLRGQIGTTNAPSGTAAGDMLCQLAAEGAQRPGTFRAFLSDSTSKALDGVTGAGPWYNTGGSKVFNNKAGLSSAPLASLAYDEHGKPVYGDVWLGGSTTESCSGWTTASFSIAGAMADLGEMRATRMRYCGERAHLYCLEQ